MMNMGQDFSSYEEEKRAIMKEVREVMVGYETSYKKLINLLETLEEPEVYKIQLEDNFKNVLIPDLKAKWGLE